MSRRRHDLDALRAVAMLLGIVLHGVLSFVPFHWLVEDANQSDWLAILIPLIHGFRMPLFFMLSGFFTAMLWRKRSLKALLWHRFKRIFLPLLLSAMTIIPLMIAITQFLENDRNNKLDSSHSVWDSVIAGNIDEFKKWMSREDFDANAVAPDGNAPMVTVAAFLGHSKIVELLIKDGADINLYSRDGGTALHAAAFLGRTESATLLLQHGADVNVKNGDGLTPIEVARVDWEATEYVANLLDVQIDRQAVDRGRNAILKMLKASTLSAPRDSRIVDDIVASANRIPLYHLWFLWFLCLYVIAFIGYSAIVLVLPLKNAVLKGLVCTPMSLLWLLPLTLLPQSMMEPDKFGPDTSLGIFPMLNVLGYYAIFFYFGSLYWDMHDTANQLGRHWWIWLPIAILMVFPVAMLISVEDAFSDFAQRALLFNVLQAVYAWLMIFGSIGLFTKLFSNENKMLRYISDSSYWLYLAHLPLILMAQWWLCKWPLNPLLKFVLVCVTVSGFLLMTYEYLIRYTLIGTLLNGKRHRPARDQNSIDGF